MSRRGRVHERAIAFFRRLGDQYCEAVTLTELGGTQHAGGEPEEAAKQAWQRAARILDDLGHPDAAEAQARLTWASGA
ncbi:hypothetical protein [Allorhizocola rhizosphaerae]|uniref:hypothetical protein n=1 Tax=Allorhizocola rhizosphaerae TaxID=1872709 RepID=UPI000E3E2ECE|nr:hypothetical protein [Allorhizocola rhizosphaerae]